MTVWTPPVLGLMHRNVVNRAGAGGAAPAGSLADPMHANQLNSQIWGGVFGNVTQSSAGTLFTNPAGYTGYNGFASKAAYNLTGSQFSSRVVSAGNQALSSWECQPVMCGPDLTNNFLAWYINGNTCLAQVKLAGVNSFPGSVAYSAAVTKYFRIREAGGSVFWDWSTDGVTWTNVWSQAAPFAVTAAFVQASAGTYNPELSATAFTIDNFGIAP